MSLIGDYGFPVIEVDGYRKLLNDAGAIQDALEYLQLRLAQDFLNVWATIPDSWGYDRRRRYLTEVLADLQLVYGSDAAALVSEFLNLSRDGADLPVVLARASNVDEVGAAVGWAMSKPETQNLLWGAMQRMMNNTYRKTIQDSAFAAGNGFARVPDANACGFCLMLASRGAVYYSRKEAREIGVAVGSRPRAKERSADRDRQALLRGVKADYGYHDNCKCTVIEVTSRTGLTEANVFLDRLWGETFYDDPDTRTKLKVNPETGRKHRPNLKDWEKAVSQADLPWLSAKQFLR